MCECIMCKMKLFAVLAVCPGTPLSCEFGTQQAGSKTCGSMNETGRNLLVMPGVKAGKGSAEDREDSADVSN